MSHKKLRSSLRLSCLLLILLSGCGPSEESSLRAIIGAVLLDGTGGPPISNSVVLVAGSRIRAAGSRVNVPIPAGSEKINGSGKFLIPGLIDVHVHLGSRAGPQFAAADYSADRIEKNLNAYLYFGVTTVRSTGTDREAGFAVRKAGRDGTLLTSRMFTAGRGFIAPGGPPLPGMDIMRQPDGPDEARRQVAELAAQQVDAIKIWVDDLGGKRPKLKPSVIEAILDEARKHSIPVTAHIRTLADTKFLVENGAAGFLHMFRDAEEIDPAFLDRLRNLQTIFAPTLVRQELSWLYKEHPERLADPEVVRTVDADVIAAVRAATAAWQASPAARHEFEVAMRNTRRLAAHGILMAVGSDAGSPIDFPGLMTHREMELLVEAGLSPLEALVAATRNGALALHKIDELGTIERGKRADLLLLNANPTEDIRNARRIDRIMLNGQWIDRAALKLR